MLFWMEIHPSTPIRCSEVSRSTEAGYSLQSLIVQDASAREGRPPLGPCRSGKHWKQQLLSQQGLGEHPRNDTWPRNQQESPQTVVLGSPAQEICNRLDKPLPGTKLF